MFKVTNSNDSLVEVTDTNDRVAEIYSKKNLAKLLIDNPDICIDGVVLVQDAKMTPFVFVYSNEDVLFDGDDLSLVLDRGNEVVHLISKRFKKNFSLAGFWINSRGRVQVVNTITNISHRFSGDKVIPKSLLIFACKTAEEYICKISSLFLDFGDCIVEFHVYTKAIGIVLPYCVEKEI